jgi:hypothetical protein
MRPESNLKKRREQRRRRDWHIPENYEDGTHGADDGNRTHALWVTTGHAEWERVATGTYAECESATSRWIGPAIDGLMLLPVAIVILPTGRAPDATMRPDVVIGEE